MSSSSFNTDDQKIKQMYETVLDHVGGWDKAKQTHLVCKIEGDDVPIIKTNDPKSAGNVHAEKLLIADLQKNDRVNETNGSSGADPDLSEDLKNMSLDESKKKCNDKETNLPDLLNITVYINNSPCSHPDHKCTDKLIRFLDRYRRIQLNLYVTSLFNIRRESCISRQETHSVNDWIHTKTCDGLRNLMHHERCKIKAFTKDDWKELFGIANVSQEVSSQLLSRYDTTTAGNDRSREEEDKRIESDLNFIYPPELEKKD